MNNGNAPLGNARREALLPVSRRSEEGFAVLAILRWDGGSNYLGQREAELRGVRSQAELGTERKRLRPNDVARTSVRASQRAWTEVHAT